MLFDTQNVQPMERKVTTQFRDKNDGTLCLKVYHEYMQIPSELDPNHVSVYTDGSRSQEDKRSGYGIRIVLNHYGSQGSFLSFSLSFYSFCLACLFFSY